jgi:CHAT domain-containing protein/tetratricopeptide (TPR) repeat protein
MRCGLFSALACLIICVSACPRVVSQEPNPLERAAPCKLAGERAEETINGTTKAEVYSAALIELRGTVQAFVAKTGENEESSLHCLNYQGATLLRLGELEEASRVYRQAAEIARRNFGDGDDSTLTLQGNLAVVLTSIGSLEEAERLQRDTLARRESLDGTPRAHKLAITLLNLAMAESALGDISKAREFADRGWSLAQKYISIDDRRWGTVLHTYGMILDQGGLRAKGQSFFEQSLAVRSKNDDSEGTIESLASLAASFYDTGRFEEADQRYREAYDLAKQVFPPLHPTTGKIARSYCRDLSSIGKVQESLAKCDEALQIFEAHGEQGKVEAYLTQINRGVTLGLLGRDSDAIETLRAAVTGLHASFPAYSPELFEGIRSLGVVLVDANRVNEGAVLLSTALKEQRALLGDSHPDVVLTQGNYAVVLAMQGKLREAESELLDYAKKADTMRRLYGRDERTVRGVFSRFAATRMFLAKLFVAEGRCQDAFDWIEETKARSLRDRIREHASIGAASVEDRVLFASLEQARTRLYLERARNAGNGAKQTEIDARLHEIDERQGEIVARVPKRSNVAGTETPSTAIIRSGINGDITVGSFALVDDEVLVTSYRRDIGFHCTSLGQWSGLDETIWATHAVQSSVRGIPGLLAGTSATPASRVIRTGARSFVLIPRAAPIPQGATIVNSTDDLLSVTGRELMDWLIKQADTTHRLVLSPDGILNLVAFDALVVDGKFLINRFSVSEVDSYAPSAAEGKNKSSSKNRQVMIAFGDPTYSSSGIASSTTDSVSKASSAIRGSIDEAANWAPLPASAVELRALSSIYNLVPSKTLFTRESANVQTLKALDSSGGLAKAQFLVFSAHAFADVNDPELSSVVLSVPSGGTPRDAYLTATDIASLNLNSDLVFFSACETGFGQVVSGEGVLSLSSAALVAGSRSTVHTLWSVVDTSSAEFTKRFFSYVKNNIPLELALTRTKRDFTGEAGHAAPAFWAPYTLVQSQVSIQ